MVITTDHGEMLGEHGWVDHGRQLYEPNNRSVLVAIGDGLPDLPEPVSTLETYPLLRHGRLESYPVEAVALHDRSVRELTDGRRGASKWAAWWERDQKWVWRDGEVARFDLAADPAERNPLPASLERLELLGRRVESAGLATEVDDELIQMLREVGYLE